MVETRAYPIFITNSKNVVANYIAKQQTFASDFCDKFKPVNFAGNHLLQILEVLQHAFPLVLELGIGCFLLAHGFYITLFLKAFKYRFSHLVYYLPILLMIYCAKFLMPSLGPFLIPVSVYFCILMLMVLSAFQVKQQGLIVSA